VDQAAPTRAARLKWVVVVDGTVGAGRALNAAICVAASTAVEVRGLLGSDASDADGQSHPGLPWAGCTVLTANRETMIRIRARAHDRSDIFVADMPEAAQATRVYDEYLSVLASTPAADITPLALSLVGPRNAIDRLVGSLPLMA
jgi:hypothetical protein